MPGFFFYERFFKQRLKAHIPQKNMRRPMTPVNNGKKTKRLALSAFLAGLLMAQGAMAANDGTAAVGGGLGGALGNVVGGQLGGSTGAAIGAGVGGAAGSAVGANKGSRI